MGFHRKGIHLIGTATIGPKGQVVIPVEAREKMGVKPGDKLIALYMDDHCTIAFMTENELHSIIDHMGSHLSKISQAFHLHSK